MFITMIYINKVIIFTNLFGNYMIDKKNDVIELFSVNHCIYC